MNGRRPPCSVVVTVADAQRELLPRCVAAVRAQTVSGLELVVVDNTASQDVAVEVGGAIGAVHHVRNPVRPSWFCANYNLGISAARGESVLALNLDAFLAPDFLEHALQVLAERPDVGLVSGKLLKLDEQGSPYDPPRIDSAGMILTLDQRHLDRGSDAIDVGQYDTPEYVFGVSGAAFLVRRATLEAILVDGACFDPDFVHGREDGDACLRAQVRGWKTFYQPRAVAHHIRTIRPGGRRALPPWLNSHQVKNRWLLRINNLPWGVRLLLAPTILARDLQAIAYVLVAERSSMPAFRWLWRERRRLRGRRRVLLQARRVSQWYLVSLFLGGMRERLRRWRARTVKAVDAPLPSSARGLQSPTGARE